MSRDGLLEGVADRVGLLDTVLAGESIARHHRPPDSLSGQTAGQPEVGELPTDERRDVVDGAKTLLRLVPSRARGSHLSMIALYELGEAVD